MTQDEIDLIGGRLLREYREAITTTVAAQYKAWTVGNLLADLATHLRSGDIKKITPEQIAAATELVNGGWWLDKELVAKEAELLARCRQLFGKSFQLI